MAEAITIDGQGFHERINAIANRIVYGVPLDPKSDPHEVAAAKLVLRWELEQETPYNWIGD
jgi:hypothetical protein